MTCIHIYISIICDTSYDITTYIWKLTANVSCTYTRADLLGTAAASRYSVRKTRSPGCCIYSVLRVFPPRARLYVYHLWLILHIYLRRKRGLLKRGATSLPKSKKERKKRSRNSLSAAAAEASSSRLDRDIAVNSKIRKACQFAIRVDQSRDRGSPDTTYSPEYTFLFCFFFLLMHFFFSVMHFSLVLIALN